MDEESHWNAWQRAIEGDEVDAMQVLHMAAMYERYFKEVQSQAAKVLRGEGRTWQEIADSVGITKQTAWQKWGSPAEKGKEFAERLLDHPKFARP
jgi:hypothetical protein